MDRDGRGGLEESHSSLYTAWEEVWQVRSSHSTKPGLQDWFLSICLMASAILCHREQEKA